MDINPDDNRAPNSTATATTAIRVYGLGAIHPSPISKLKKSNRGEAKLEVSLPLAGASSLVTSAGAPRKLNYEQDVYAVADADAETKSAPEIAEYISAKQSQRLTRELNKSPEAVKRRLSCKQKS